MFTGFSHFTFDVVDLDSGKKVQDERATLFSNRAFDEMHDRDRKQHESRYTGSAPDPRVIWTRGKGELASNGPIPWAS